jgi:hypothetical protein
MSEIWTFLVLSKTCNVLKKILGGGVLQPTPTPATDFPVSSFWFFSQTFSLAILLGNLPLNSLFQDPVFPIFTPSQTFPFNNCSGQSSLLFWEIKHLECSCGLKQIWSA